MIDLVQFFGKALSFNRFVKSRFMCGVIRHCFLSWKTNVYDIIQYKTNSVFYWWEEQTVSFWFIVVKEFAAEQKLWSTDSFHQGNNTFASGSWWGWSSSPSWTSVRELTICCSGTKTKFHIKARIEAAILDTFHPSVLQAFLSLVGSLAPVIKSILESVFQIYLMHSPPYEIQEAWPCW